MTKDKKAPPPKILQPIKPHPRVADVKRTAKAVLKEKGQKK
jgi:hypothetical protein